MVRSLAGFNAAPTAAAEVDVLAWCESKAFATTVARGRPYHEAADLYAAIDAAFEALTWDDILEAMSAHPRIGERAGGISAAEQAGAAAAGAAARHALAAGNLAYEQRFGHVFLICASGLSGQEMLGQLQARLQNSRMAERTAARQELRKITRLRMQKQLGL
jgi:2-oxo-4-hydroxy-4-carboxy-5-ureidoimidazoline decarboxylase